MRKVLLFCYLLTATTLSAQLVTTDPAAPTDDGAVTITFDATQGTGGLADCDCDVYLHTGVITNVSDQWRYVVTTNFNEANPEWRMDRVAGEANLYTYTLSPTLREYYDAPRDEIIERIALVFRNGDGSLEGKASGGQDIFIDVSEGGGALGITTTGNPEQEFWPLGRPLPVQLGATTAGTLEIFDNGALVASGEGTTLSTDVIFTTAGARTVRFVATSDDNQTAVDSFTINARLEATFLEPVNTVVRVEPGTVVSLTGTSYIQSDLSLSTGTGELIDRDSTQGTQSYNYELPTDQSVTTLTLTAVYQGDTAIDRVTYVSGEPIITDPPADLPPGATDMANGDVRLLLRAPGKNDVFVVHNFNGYLPTATTRLKKSGNGNTFWLELTDLPVGEDLIYTYLIDGEIVQPDPYSKLVLDPLNDRFIGQETFTGIPTYPADAASGILTWHPRSRPDYDWQSSADYRRPDPERMVVYELLIRDFIAAHDYQTLTDTLDYLERLGINAIELMPVNEFEGNLSWGYNPSFHMALDKYYGPPDALKGFVDECHTRGIAVILDVVYNHAFSQSPLARMWWNQDDFRPAPDNPYLNVEARHPFNVGYDFNHESNLTKEYVKITTEYWLKEFRIDGFRWDLSKGFTQVNYGDDVGRWSRYDTSRVAILKDYADHVWGVDDEAYMILEHLAERREEDELAGYGNGMYFWTGAGLHNQYLEAAMGYSSDLGGIVEDTANAVGGKMPYMESHDEERMQYKNEQFGNGTGTYRVKEQPTGLDRVELASAFFYTVPGPKLLWQFGELGYDFPINYCSDGSQDESCRTGNKPIVWEYTEEENRQDVYNWIADLNYLRNNYDFFHGEVTASSLSGETKYINLRHPTSTDESVVVVGNFGVTTNTITNVFPNAGTWHDYVNGEAINVRAASQALELEAGEYRVYLSQDIARGGGNLGTSTGNPTINRLNLDVQPNPTDGALTVTLQSPVNTTLSIKLLDINGRTVSTLFAGRVISGAGRFDLTTGRVPSGMYYLQFTDGVGVGIKKIIVR